MREPLRITAEMRSKDKATAAKAYIKAGLSILLTEGINKVGHCTCGNRSCSSAGKHPLPAFPHGVKSATRDIARIRRLLHRNPDANIAICLDGKTVLDVDGPEGAALLETLTLPETATVKTSRGKHCYFEGELSGRSFKANQIDLLSGGSRYVLAPPSRHASGVNYRWLHAEGEVMARVPENELERLRRATKKTIRFPGGKIRTGERNDRLFKAACALRARGFSDEAIYDGLRAINEKDCTEPLSEDELRKLVTSSGRYTDNPEELFGVPVQREPLPIEFLWYPYIPRHAVTIIAGDPGRGKSLLIALLIATITSRLRWPLSSDRCDGQQVLLLSAEDNWARVTLRRLLKAGAKIENVHVMHNFRTLSDERLAALVEHVRKYKIDLVVIDTLAAYMGADRDMHRQNEVGEFLAFLNEMAEESGCAVVALAHLNKQTAEHPLFRIVGSIGFAATIRSACFLGSDPSDRTRLALAHGKANASEIGKTIVFEKVGGGKDDVPVLRPIEFSDASVVDVCKVERGDVGRPSAESAAAREFVLDYLEVKKPRAWEGIVRASAARTIASAGTLANVRAELAKEGLIRQIGKGRKALWVRAAPSEKPDE